MVAFLKSHMADIICLQELTIGAANQSIKHGPNYIAKELGYNYYFKECPVETVSGVTELFANGIFSRFPIVKSSWSRINEPSGTGGYDDENRVYAEVTLKIDGHNFSVGTTHMSYTHMFEGTERKRTETDKILAQIGQHEQQFIFTGDLNALPGSYTVEGIGKKLVNAGPGFDQKTWTTKPFSYQGFEANELSWRLDYIFATPDIKVISSEIVATEYSDHLPMLVKFKL